MYLLITIHQQLTSIPCQHCIAGVVCVSDITILIVGAFCTTPVCLPGQRCQTFASTFPRWRQTRDLDVAGALGSSIVCGKCPGEVVSGSSIRLSRTRHDSSIPSHSRKCEIVHGMLMALTRKAEHMDEQSDIIG